MRRQLEQLQARGVSYSDLLSAPSSSRKRVVDWGARTGRRGAPGDVDMECTEDPLDAEGSSEGLRVGHARWTRPRTVHADAQPPVTFVPCAAPLQGGQIARAILHGGQAGAKEVNALLGERPASSLSTALDAVARGVDEALLAVLDVVARGPDDTRPHPSTVLPVLEAVTFTLTWLTRVCRQSPPASQFVASHPCMRDISASVAAALRAVPGAASLPQCQALAARLLTLWAAVGCAEGRAAAKAVDVVGLACTWAKLFGTAPVDQAALGLMTCLTGAPHNPDATLVRLAADAPAVETICNGALSRCAPLTAVSRVTLRLCLLYVHHVARACPGVQSCDHLNAASRNVFRKYAQLRVPITGEEREMMMAIRARFGWG